MSQTSPTRSANFDPVFLDHGIENGNAYKSAE